MLHLTHKYTYMHYTYIHKHYTHTCSLWTAGSGRIIRPPAGETFFLPQRPYCTLGTLREQLLYPQRPGSDVGHDLSDDELLEILRKVCMHAVLSMCITGVLCLRAYVHGFDFGHDLSDDE